MCGKRVQSLFISSGGLALLDGLKILAKNKKKALHPPFLLSESGHPSEDDPAPVSQLRPTYFRLWFRSPISPELALRNST